MDTSNALLSETNMEAKIKANIAEDILRLRHGQIIINEKYKNGDFKIPIHLALGHEAIAVAVDQVMTADDQLAASHRNLHYNLARSRALKKVIDEFLLKPSGLARGSRGSMNLANEAAGIVYTSSILGNNLSVAAGLAMAKKVKGDPGLVYVVTGDGAMEEGAMYESLSLMKSQELPVVIIVENNGWSLATQIHERRCDIFLSKLSATFGTPYVCLEGNDCADYVAQLQAVRRQALSEKGPVVVEVVVATLGDWRLKTEEYPDGKYINYHAGPAPTVEIDPWPLLQEEISDPVYTLRQILAEEELKSMSRHILAQLLEEIE